MDALTREWVRKAEADWTSAQALAKLKPPPTDPACFHCQQTAEKYLKALLQQAGLKVPRTHDLMMLLRVLSAVDSSLKTLSRGLPKLTTYAVESRYPGMHASRRQLQSALRLALNIRLACRRRLGLRSSSS